MKIAFVGTRGITTSYSGIETSLKETSRRLAQKGHKITVYCHSARKIEPLPIEPFQNVKLIFIPTVNSKHFATFIHTFLSTFHLLFSDIDIVHFHALGPSFFSFLPRIFGKKTVVSVHGLDWKRKKWKSLARFFLKSCEFTAIYFPHRTIVVAKNLKNYFEGKFKKKVYYIPNGINVCPEESESYKKDTPGSYVLCAARLVPEKGIHYLIRAFNELNTYMKLIIAGESSFTDGYASYLRSISGPRVEFVDFKKAEELRELYKKAYIFVLPSEVEGLPVSLLEAMSHGTCPLVSNIPECLEVVGDCGVYFRSGDYLDLRDKLRYLIDNPGIAIQLGLRAKKRASEQFAWGPIIDELEMLYISLQN